MNTKPPVASLLRARARLPRSRKTSQPNDSALGRIDHHLSASALNAAFERIGYAGRITPHGLRATASTLLNELGFDRDAIELQLAHVERDLVRASYNHADKLTERRTMMQAWADYVDALEQGGNVVPMRRTAA